MPVPSSFLSVALGRLFLPSPPDQPPFALARVLPEGIAWLVLAESSSPGPDPLPVAEASNLHATSSLTVSCPLGLWIRPYAPFNEADHRLSLISQISSVF